MFNGEFHYKWPFSIAMLTYQRVNGDFRMLLDGLLLKRGFVLPKKQDSQMKSGDIL